MPWPLDADRGMMPFMSGNAYEAQCGYCDWAPVRVIGTVPVASDGSAYFQVPADVAIYFQALDERQMEVRRMRSMVSLKPGEVRGCRGCHESQAKTPVTAWTAAAGLARTALRARAAALGCGQAARLHLARAADPGPALRPLPRPRGAAGSAGLHRDGGRRWTGPVVTGRCSGCCRHPSPPGRKLVAVADRFGNAAVSQPKQFGSHRSPLVQVLLQDDLHRAEVRLSDVEWLSLVTWIDANAPYFDAFINKRPADGKPRRDVASLIPVP